MIRMEDIAPKLLSLDIEGDGQRRSHPIELGICMLAPEWGEGYSWLIRSPSPISRFATKVHGIKNSDLLTAPLPAVIEREVLGMLEGAVIVGHSVRDDLKALERAFPSLPRFEVIDTLPMSRQLMQGLPSYSLQNVAASLGVSPRHPGRGPHSALYDASIGAAVFEQLCQRVGADRYLRGVGVRLGKARAAAPSP